MNTRLAYTIAEACEAARIGRTSIYDAINSDLGRRLTSMASRFAGQNAASDFKTAEYCRPSGYRNRPALGVHTRDAGTGRHLGQLDARAGKRKSRHRWRRHRAIERFYNETD